MSMFNEPVRYNIYPSALDAFEGYINADATWEQYWGSSEKPYMTDDELALAHLNPNRYSAENKDNVLALRKAKILSPEQFEKKCFHDLISKLNRVPMLWEESEPADRGTAFNEVVDAFILNRPINNEKVTFCKSDRERGVVNITYNKRDFEFSLALCREFATYYQGAVPQMFVEGHLKTKFGTVHLYGYADEVAHDGKCCDIKTTSQYKAGKFRNNSQHLVYPFCLKQMGIDCNEFEYNVTNFKETFTEHYLYTEKSEQDLLERVERFIDFIENHRHLITDKKLFNQC